jgi:hypothetical protein
VRLYTDTGSMQHGRERPIAIDQLMAFDRPIVWRSRHFHSRNR